MNWRRPSRYLISFGLRLPLRLGLRIADGFRQHLAQFSLGLRGFPRFCHCVITRYMGMPEGELNPLGLPADNSCPLLLGRSPRAPRTANRFRVGTISLSI